MSIIKSNGYSVTVGNHSLKALNAFLKKKHFSSHFVICDENTLQHCLPLLITNCPILSDAEIIEMESGEQSKDLAVSAHIWQTLLEHKADSNSVIINLGGGVVSDLGGFCAAVYKRGISFINVPTSLLAMADASVGGKTAIDFGGIKNSIGLFAQPAAVFVYPTFLNSLPEKHYKNGMAEVFKIALISDKKFWDELKRGYLNFVSVEQIEKSIVLKNNSVLKDPFDKGLRKSLNFGHTIGHALEAVLLGTKTELLHGEAVVIGMLVESHIALQKKLITQKQGLEIFYVLHRFFQPKKINEKHSEKILKLIRNDKKTSANKPRFALVSGIGKCKVDVEVTETQIKKAVEFFNKSVKFNV
ncbi:MAG: 3-dehydroquinate synthase [Bacteroidetes bacterium]|nr:3-dehydroquinate synthase [Bacteroidota bacterium]